MKLKKYLRRSYIEDFLSKQKFSGDILEIGSGRKWQYITGSTTQNIDSTAEPDIVGNAEAMPEIASASYDVVLCLEVIEHTEHPQKVIDEIHRVLRPGGCLILSAPFNLEIHDVNDYWRFTRQGFAYLLRNFSYIELHNNGGKYSVQFHFLRISRVGKFVYPLVNYLGWQLDSWLSDGSRMTLGYIAKATK